MTALEARVHNGRLVLDEPTDLPEGEVVYLTPVEAEVDEVDDGFDEEEREALHEALDEGIDAARAGDHVDAEEVVSELLARKLRLASRRRRAGRRIGSTDGGAKASAG